MTIREVLQADWNVDAIEVRVRTAGRLARVYHIGERVEPSRYMRFAHETEAGDVYTEPGISAGHVFIKRTIQHQFWEGAKKSLTMCVGVLLDQIPKEILGLNVQTMMPESFGSGHASGMHGYCFEAETETLVWTGIRGEDRLIEPEEEEKEESQHE